DPAADRVLGYWPGSASAEELRGFVEESLALGGKLDHAGKLLAKGRNAQAAGEFDKAAPAYAGAAVNLPLSSPRKNAALMGWLSSLASGHDWAASVRVGTDNIGKINGAAMPADYASELLRCAEKVDKGPDQDGARAAAVAKLRAFTAAPPPEATADDRADA